MENRRLMSKLKDKQTCSYAVYAISCWLFVIEQRKAVDYRDFNQLKTCNSKENPRHSNHFQLNCLSLQSSPSEAIYWYVSCYQEYNSQCYITSWGIIFPKHPSVLPQIFCCHSPTCSPYSPKSSGWYLLLHSHDPSYQRTASRNSLFNWKLLQTS